MQSLAIVVGATVQVTLRASIPWAPDDVHRNEERTTTRAGYRYTLAKKQNILKHQPLTNSDDGDVYRYCTYIIKFGPRTAQARPCGDCTDSFPIVRRDVQTKHFG